MNAKTPPTVRPDRVKTPPVLNLAFGVIVLFYVFLMLDVFFRIHLVRSGAAFGVNAVPLRTIVAYLSGEAGVSRAAAARNLLGNVLVFAPLGACLQTMLKDKRFGKTLLILALASAAIELTQLLLGRGAADVDDWLLNVCSGALGAGLYRLLRRLLGSGERAEIAVKILSLVIGLPVLAAYAMICVRRYC